MRFPITTAFCALLLGAAPAGAAEAPAEVRANLPAHVGRHTSSPEDQREIAQVVADFQAAIKTKNVRQLASLMVNTDIPFVSPPPPQGIKKAREMIDPNANGLHAGGFHGFARFLHESKVPLEERFYNVKITQDKNVAWVMFDYEFVEDGKVVNYGIETWQMMQNVEGKWKIASVWWTYNPMQ